MAFVEGSDSIEAAKLRKLVFVSPKPGDDEILGKRIDEILADQQPDGALSDHELHALLVTGGTRLAN